MKRKTLFFLLFFVFWLGSAVPQSSPLKIQEIPRIMERFFHFHIENSELNAAIVKRSLKLYIEQFDPEKAYLLESEVFPYFNMDEKSAKAILERLKRGDYSDFVELNTILQESILRAQKKRLPIAVDLASQEEIEEGSRAPNAQYAKTEKELRERQKNRMVRFYLFHKMRTHLETPERRLQVYHLFEKKVRRGEYNYLFVDSQGISLPEEQIAHLFSIRILKAFAKSLDTHTSFFSPEEAYEMRLSLEKQFEGVGIVLSEGIDGVMIAELIPGSPAKQSGEIRINDLLVEIDGQSVEQLSFEEILELLKKKDRGEIILGVKHSDQELSVQRIALVKRPIVMEDARIQTSSEKFGNGIIGKIALHSFYESSSGHSSEKDIRAAIRKFQKEGELLGLVLDLRENSGGFLSQAVKVAGLFVSNGVIVISKYGKGEVHYLRNVAGKSFFSGPLIILTSKMSASASEIVAQALQDYGVGLVVGDERTFGKGSIQYQTVTDERADLFFKVTVGRYYTPSGKSTQIDGVIADILVPTQYAPYRIGERYLEFPLPPDQVDPAFNDPLTDLDAKTKRLFQLRYLPHLQRVVSFWKKALPLLRKNSAQRIASDPNFQAFLKKQEKIRARQTDSSVNTIDEPIQIGMEDLQIMEAVNIVKDMIQIEAESRDTPATLAPTGSD